MATETVTITIRTNGEILSVEDELDATQISHSSADDSSTSAPEPPEPKMKPWEDLSRGAKGLNLPMSAELYAKMLWCTENIPKMSLQKLARLGAEKLADELIAQHFNGR